MVVNPPVTLEIVVNFSDTTIRIDLTTGERTYYAQHIDKKVFIASVDDGIETILSTDIHEFYITPNELLGRLLEYVSDQLNYGWNFYWPRMPR